MSDGERPDAYYVGRLLGKLKLLIATDDEVPMDTKLDTQAMIKEFARHLSAPLDEQDVPTLQAQHNHLLVELEDFPNCESLLLALPNFAPNL
ncbi:MAG: hypothetical protein VCC00_09475 [Deltaproteobacteria bacterium]